MLLPGRLHPFIAWRIWLLTRIDVCWNSLSAFQPSCSAWAFPWSHPSFIHSMSIHMAWLILPIPSLTLLRYSLRMLRVDIYAQTPPPVWAPFVERPFWFLRWVCDDLRRRLEKTRAWSSCETMPFLLTHHKYLGSQLNHLCLFVHALAERARCLKF